MGEIRLSSPGSRILLALACFTSFALLSLYLFFSPFGLDFTDEGFYFNWYKYPDSFPAAITYFGFVYAFPYRLLGENIVALRVLNIFSVFVAGAWCVDQAFTASARSKELFGNSSIRIALVLSLAGLSLLGLGKFSSPSYNHLALIGCYLVAGSLLRSSPLEGRASVGIVSFGLPFVGGIVLASLAKPTTGVVLGVISLAFAFLSKRGLKSSILLCLLVSAILSIVAAAFFSGGIPELLAKSMLGKQWISILDGGHDIKGLIRSIFQALLYPPFLPFAFILVLQERIISFSLKLSNTRSRAYVLVSIAVLLAVFLSLFAMRGLLARSGVSTLTGTWFVAMPLVLAVYSLKAKSLKSVNIDKADLVRPIAGFSRLLLILLIPFGYGFGTNTGIWGKALSASLILVSVSAYLLAQIPPRSMKSAFSGFLLCFLIGQVLFVPSYAAFFLKPHRQPQPLFLNSSVTRIGSNSQLRLSKGFSEYIASARNALLQSGFKLGTPILDLSGQSPGLIYALEGRAIGQAWMIGGYKGSNLLGKKAIAKIPCKDLRSAWLIVEPGGPRSLDLSILESFGIDIEDLARYQKVTDLVVPSGAGGYTIDRRQIIYKPIANDNASFKCS
jgi:hypothetical protein